MMSANNANCSVVFSFDAGRRALRMLSSRGWRREVYKTCVSKLGDVVLRICSLPLEGQ